MNHRIVTAIIATSLVALALPAAAAGGLGGALNALAPDAPLAKECRDAAPEDPLASATILMDVDAVQRFATGAQPASHDPVFGCEGIRPGGALVLRIGGLKEAYCTIAFILEDADGALYAATAGHCLDPDLGVPTPRVSAHGVPGEFGTEVFRWCEGGDATGAGCGGGEDFSLIKIDEDKYDYVSPEMCHWGAPTGGVFTARDIEPRPTFHFGWGLGVGSASAGVGMSGDNPILLGNPATQARTGVGFDFSNANMAIMFSAAVPKDSGSGVMVDDWDGVIVDGDPQALGVLTHISAGGLAIVQRLDESLARAENELGTTFTLH